MQDTTIRKAPMLLLCGAMLTLALTACNREPAPVDEPAATATVADTMPADTMPAEPMTLPPPAGATLGMPPASTMAMPPSSTTGMPPSSSTVGGVTATEPPMDANGNPTQ
jgi:hypothetical protein